MPTIRQNDALFQDFLDEVMDLDLGDFDPVEPEKVVIDYPVTDNSWMLDGAVVGSEPESYYGRTAEFVIINGEIDCLLHMTPEAQAETRRLYGERIFWGEY